MQLEVWARLTSPFPPEALTWIVAELSADGSRARLEPAWVPEAVRARLDSEIGVEGWSYTLQAAGAAGVVCALTIAGVTRSAAASTSVNPEQVAIRSRLESTAALAFARCARQFDIRPPVESTDDTYWVDFDPETGESIYDPEPVPIRQNLPSILEGLQVERAAPTDSQPATEHDPGALRGASNEALAMIEKLIDRLKAEGLGREAAKLVATYHGGSAEDARELYRRLRELLKQEVSA